MNSKIKFFLILILSSLFLITSCGVKEEKGEDDTTPPVIKEITPVSSPTTNKANAYTFNSSESGNITVGGSCSLSNYYSSASSGDNQIVLEVSIARFYFQIAKINII